MRSARCDLGLSDDQTKMMYASRQHDKTTITSHFIYLVCHLTTDLHRKFQNKTFPKTFTAHCKIIHQIKLTLSLTPQVSSPLLVTR